MSNIQKRTIGIRFGTMAPKLREQIKDAGFRAYYGDVAEWQADADAITRLSIRGLLSESEKAASQKRLMKLITGGIAE